MSANYGEAYVAGKQWQRAAAMNIYNPFGGVASVVVQEERLIQLDESIVTQAVPMTINEAFAPEDDG